MAKHYPYLQVQIAGKKTRMHRIRAEKALGHPLPKGAHVHHADGSFGDDAPLVICENTAYHSLLHRRMNIVRAGGNPNTDAWCSRCHKPKHKSEFWQHKSNASGVQGNCKACGATIQIARKAALFTSENAHV